MEGLSDECSGPDSVLYAVQLTACKLDLASTVHRKRDVVAIRVCSCVSALAGLTVTDSVVARCFSAGSRGTSCVRMTSTL